MADRNPIVRSHVFSLGEMHGRLAEFLSELRKKEIEAAKLQASTKATDLVLKEIRFEWSKIQKEADQTICNSIKEDKSVHPILHQLRESCLHMKNMCKVTITRLSERLSLKLGMHVDNYQWIMSTKSLPRTVTIQGYSNPSIFCFMISFMKLLDQNPVQSWTYMPSLYDILGERNRQIVSSIRINHNPNSYKEFFQVILEKYASIESTLQQILERMDTIGQLQKPTNPQQFQHELEKSNLFQGIFNVIGSWIKIIMTINKEDHTENMIYHGPHNHSLISKLKAMFVSDRISQCIMELTVKSPKQQFHYLEQIYTAHHHGLQAYVNQTLEHTKK